MHGRIQRSDRSSGPPEKAQKYRVSLQNWSRSPEKKHKAIKPAFNVGPSSARQQNAISMAFRWRADYGPFIAVTKLSRFIALTKLSRSAHGACFLISLKSGDRVCLKSIM